MGSVCDGTSCTRSPTAIDAPGGSRTQLDFELVVGDVGKYLDRIGYPGTVKRGSATLAGKLAWNGAPSGPDLPSLAGDLKLSAERGQFAKLEPGIGKLIGLLSLQPLPRSITLDFRVVFSEGFAFDSIDGTFQVHNGLMKTSDLTIDGPAAKVNLKGEVNLGDETSEAVAKRLRAARTPFITLSSYSRSQHPPVFAEAPVLFKPLRSELLLAELKRCLH